MIEAKIDGEVRGRITERIDKKKEFDLRGKSCGENEKGNERKLVKIEESFDNFWCKLLKSWRNEGTDESFIRKLQQT